MTHYHDDYFPDLTPESCGIIQVETNANNCSLIEFLFQHSIPFASRRVMECRIPRISCSPPDWTHKFHYNVALDHVLIIKMELVPKK